MGKKNIYIHKKKKEAKAWSNLLNIYVKYNTNQVISFKMINIFKEAPEQREKRKSLVNKIFVINKLAINNIGIFFL